MIRVSCKPYYTYHATKTWRKLVTIDVLPNLVRLNNSRHYRSEMVAGTIIFDSKTPISQIKVRSSEGFVSVITFMAGRG